MNETELILEQLLQDKASIEAKKEKLSTLITNLNDKLNDLDLNNSCIDDMNSLYSKMNTTIDGTGSCGTAINYLQNVNSKLLSKLNAKKEHWKRQEKSFRKELDKAIECKAIYENELTSLDALIKEKEALNVKETE